MRSILPLLLSLALLLCACGGQSAPPATTLQPSAAPTSAAGNGTNEAEHIIETEEPDMSGQTAKLSFESFDGGGPSYDIVLDDPSLASWKVWHEYAKNDHEQMTGAGYTVTFTFTGLTPGETRLTVEQRSPIAGNIDHYYRLTVDAAGNVTLRYEGERDLDMPEPVQPTPVLALLAGDRILYANPAGSESARAFIEALSAEPLTLTLLDADGFEKAGELPWELPGSDEALRAVPGDLLLCQGTRFSLSYDESTRSCIRLANISGLDRAALLELLGPDEATVELWVEWSE